MLILMLLTTWKDINKRRVHHKEKTFKLNLKVHHNEHKEEELL